MNPKNIFLMLKFIYAMLLVFGEYFGVKWGSEVS